MTKYIPKVGEAFEWEISGCWNVCGKVVLATPLEIVWLDDFGLTQFITIRESIMRPIQTKTDVEREQLITILSKSHPHQDVTRADAIIKAGFTIPKKVKRSEIENTILDKFCNSHVLRCYLVTAICELLGDLVQQDDCGAL
jgi:hypothetical protein